MTNPTCDRCDRASKINLPYGPHRFCVEHFNDFFETRISKTIRENNLIRYGEKILVALSGGKDSEVLLHVLKKQFAKTNEISALIIDEGIHGYRDKAIAIAVESCEQLGIPHRIVSYQSEFGFTNDQIAPAILQNSAMGKSVCGYCGTFRKTILNKYAKKLHADKLATGHNLDDEAQNVLMNLLENDVPKLFSLGPMANQLDNEQCTPRIKPLYNTPEKDIITYASLNQISHYSDECCPYSGEAKRNDLRIALNNLEQKYPKTKFSLLRFLETLREKTDFKLEHAKPVLKCKNCDEPSNNDLCQSCTKQKKLHEIMATNSKQKKAKTIIPNKTKIAEMTCNQTKRM